LVTITGIQIDDDLRADHESKDGGAEPCRENDPFGRLRKCAKVLRDQENGRHDEAGDMDIGVLDDLKPSSRAA
jgi:hypothetical protein